MESLLSNLQFEAAMNYYRGNKEKGFKRNRKEAYRLFCEAAEANHVEAMMWASEMSLNGIGCIQDERKALYWLQKAAELNHSEAQCRYGWMLYVLKRRTADAMEWLRKSANQGNIKAMMHFAELSYSVGWYVDEAIDLLNQKVFDKNADAHVLIAELIYRKECEQSLYTEDIKYPPESVEHYQRALSLYEKKAHQSVYCASKAADILCKKGVGEPDYQKVFYYYELIADQPKSKNNQYYQFNAQIKLAKMLELGLGCERNLENSRKYRQQSGAEDEVYERISL